MKIKEKDAYVWRIIREYADGSIDMHEAAFSNEEDAIQKLKAYTKEYSPDNSFVQKFKLIPMKHNNDENTKNK